MALAILAQGKTSIRNNLKSIFTSIGVSDDSVAFNVAQTTVNPTGGSTTALVKTATQTDQTAIDAFTTDYTITLDASVDTTFVGKVINTISICTGNVATAAISRIVRATGLGIGFTTGDVYTVGVRAIVQDNS